MMRRLCSAGSTNLMRIYRRFRFLIESANSSQMRVPALKVFIKCVRSPSRIEPCGNLAVLPCLTIAPGNNKPDEQNSAYARKCAVRARQGNQHAAVKFTKNNNAPQERRCYPQPELFFAVKGGGVGFAFSEVQIVFGHDARQFLEGDFRGPAQFLAGFAGVTQ